MGGERAQNGREHIVKHRGENADEDDAAELRKDLDERKDVISDQSVFHDLVKDSSKSKRRTTGGFSAKAH